MHKHCSSKLFVMECLIFIQGDFNALRKTVFTGKIFMTDDFVVSSYLLSI